MAKVRVYELAKELGVESKTVLSMLKDMGEFVRSASSTVEAPVERRLKEKLASEPPPVKKAPAKKAAAKKIDGEQVSAAPPAAEVPVEVPAVAEPAPAAPARQLRQLRRRRRQYQQHQRRRPHQRRPRRQRLGPNRRRFRVRPRPGLRARLRRRLGSTSNRLRRHARVRDLRADSLAPQAHADPAHRGPGTIHSHPHRAWAGRVHHDLVQMAPALKVRVHPRVAGRRCRVLGRAYRVCRGPTRP